MARAGRSRRPEPHHHAGCRTTTLIPQLHQTHVHTGIRGVRVIRSLQLGALHIIGVAAESWRCAIPAFKESREVYGEPEGFFLPSVHGKGCLSVDQSADRARSCVLS